MSDKNADIKRAVLLLRVTGEFIVNNPLEDIPVVYDGAECDGQCLAEDCIVAADTLEGMLAKEDAK